MTVRSIVGHFIGVPREGFPRGPLFVTRQIGTLDRRASQSARTAFRVICGLCGRASMKRIEELRRARQCGPMCRVRRQVR